MDKDILACMLIGDLNPALNVGAPVDGTFTVEDPISRKKFKVIVQEA